MRAVEMVLEHQLPVAAVGVLEDAARNLELAPGRAIDEVVERSARRPEELLQARPARRGRGEDEAAVDGDTRHLFKSELLDLFLFISGLERHGAQAAASIVAPAVIRADEALYIALPVSA